MPPLTFDPGTVPGSLGPARRATDRRRMEDEQLDVLVIGGGVTGVGCALDAATRGLSVGLVEQRDLASGTSSRSSKLLHGGLRYLEQRDFALVREALHERGLLTGRLCPHLVRPVSFLLPLTRRVWHRLYYGAGVALYDLLALMRDNPLPRHRHLSRRTALSMAPALKHESLVGGILYHDAQIDDARHTLAVARTAARHGAAVLTSTRVEELLIEVREGERTVVGARLHDLETGEIFDCHARKVVNATGVWIDDIQEMAGPAGLRVRAAKGVHLVVPRDRIDSTTGIVLRTQRSVLFIIPWGDHWLVGTTDTEWHLDRAHPAASKADIDYILRHANEALERPLTADDIVGVYAGLRPLVEGDADDTTKLSREHAVMQPVPGLISIAGGKYTTYRVMAEDTIDMVAEGLGRPVPRSSTEEVVLLGSEGWASGPNWSTRGPSLAAEYGLDVHVVERLLWRHGNRITDVLDIAASAPHLGALLPGGGYLSAEVVHAARHEGALHLDDVLARRLRVSIENEARGNRVAETAAELMAAELGWDEERTEREVENWFARVEAERAANMAPGDEEADAIRRAVVDARGLIDA